MKNRKILGKGKYFGLEVFIFNIDNKKGLVELGYFKDSIGFLRDIKDKNLVYDK